MNQLRLRKLGAALGIVMASSFLPSLGLAQNPSADIESSSDFVRLEKFEVTGSYIPYSAEAPAVPVRVVSSIDIAATGQTADLLEVIRKTVPQFVGNGNIGSANSNISGGNTNGGSQIQLRNVATLVLINGRRAAFAPVSATGGFDFVDVNAIPVSAVARIEVLKDGASALYGSDAVSGVVNIILKDDYEGAEIGGQYSFSKEMGKLWEERSGHFTVGAKAGDTSVTVSAEWVRSDPIMLSERGFSSDQTGKSSSFAGVAQYVNALGNGDNKVYLLAEGATPPLNTDMSGAALVEAGIYTLPTGPVSSLINLNNATLALGNEKYSFTGAVKHKLSDRVELFGDVLYSHTETVLQLNAQPVVGMPIYAQDVDNFAEPSYPGLPFAYTLPEQAQNPFDDYTLVRNRFVDFPRLYFNDNDSIRGLLGIRGQINELYSWEIAANTNHVDQMYRNVNVINRRNLANAIDQNVINLYAREQAPGAFDLANMFGTAYSKNKSSLTSFDARLNGGFANILPGGAIMFAAGVETRRETLSAEPDAGSNTIADPNSALFGSPSDWDGATTSDDFSVDRSVDSAFLEVRVPLVGKSQAIPGLHTLDLDLAVRHDKYSDTDDPTVPKASLRWFPVNDEFAVRASYSESFSAPSLFSLFGPAGVGFTDQPVGFEFADGSQILDDPDQAFLRLIANEDLKPEEAVNYNAGIVYSPKAIKGLSVELNYFYIKQDQIAGREDDIDILQDVEDNGASSEFVDRVRFGGFNGTAATAPGQVSAAYLASGGSFTGVFVTSFEENFVAATQHGVDASIQYTFDVPEIARFDFTLNGIWFNEFSVEDEDYVGTTNGNSVLNGGTIPEWLGNLGIKMNRGNFSAGIYLTHIPSVTDTTADEDETDVTADAHVEAYTTVDLYVGYTFRSSNRYLDGMMLRVGANNVFDEPPPMAGSSWTYSNADTSTYNALGRVMYVSANYKF